MRPAPSPSLRCSFYLFPVLIAGGRSSLGFSALEQFSSAKNGCFKHSLALGSVYRSLHEAGSCKKCLKSTDHLSSSVRVGGLFFGMHIMTLIGWTSCNGGNFSAISMHVIVTDQNISFAVVLFTHQKPELVQEYVCQLFLAAFKYYQVESTGELTSGAIQYGVPTKVFAFAMVSYNCFETPKSASLTSLYQSARC